MVVSLRSYSAIGRPNVSPSSNLRTFNRSMDWLNSAEYIALDDIRSSSSNINMVVVDGL